MVGDDHELCMNTSIPGALDGKDFPAQLAPGQLEPNMHVYTLFARAGHMTIILGTHLQN